MFLNLKLDDSLDTKSPELPTVSLSEPEINYIVAVLKYANLSQPLSAVLMKSRGIQCYDSYVDGLFWGLLDSTDRETHLLMCCLLI